MASVNKVIIVGTLGKDPETRHLPDGNAVVNMSVATNSKWKDKNTGEQREETEWHRIVIYGRLAEVAGEVARWRQRVFRTDQWSQKQSPSWLHGGAEMRKQALMMTHSCKGSVSA